MEIKVEHHQISNPTCFVVPASNNSLYPIDKQLDRTIIIFPRRRQQMKELRVNKSPYKL